MSGDDHAIAKQLAIRLLRARLGEALDRNAKALRGNHVMSHVVGLHATWRTSQQREKSKKIEFRQVS